MRILLDEDIPRRLGALTLGHDQSLNGLAFWLSGRERQPRQTVTRRECDNGVHALRLLQSDGTRTGAAPLNRQVIAELRGLGPKSQAMLAGAGIKTVAQLKRIGSVRAYAKVEATGAHPSLNLLWAMEGALTGLPWQVVAREHRLSLLLALDALNRDA